MVLRTVICCLLVGCMAFTQMQLSELYAVKSGNISFKSKAPFETIKAESKELKGLLNTQKKVFAFKVKMESFDGFNSPLQKEHFNENYVESDKYPEAIFSGKIIEDIDFVKDGSYIVRAKGKLVVHGMSQERIIKSRILVKNGNIQLSSQFTISLSDFNVPIPKVVKEKLSSEIEVFVTCSFEKHES